MSLQERLQQMMNGKLDARKEEGKKFMEANATKEGVHTHESGIQYEVLKAGSGTQPKPTATIRAHYKGSLLDGSEFDNSFKRGEPFTAPLAHLIRGWQIAIPLMQEGAHWKLWIPSDLAYGDRGAGHAIPGGATLIFEIELLAVQNS